MLLRDPPPWTALPSTAGPGKNAQGSLSFVMGSLGSQLTSAGSVVLTTTHFL